MPRPLSAHHMDAETNTQTGSSPPSCQEIASEADITGIVIAKFRRHSKIRLQKTDIT